MNRLKKFYEDHTEICIIVAVAAVTTVAYVAGKKAMTITGVSSYTEDGVVHLSITQKNGTMTCTQRDLSKLQ